jgi:type IV secretory pathway TraG/TraD family ATPase VirD4
LSSISFSNVAAPLVSVAPIMSLLSGSCIVFDSTPPPLDAVIVFSRLTI